MQQILSPYLESLLQRIAVVQNLTPNEVDDLRRDTVETARTLRGMSLAEMAVVTAADVGCTPEELLAEAESLGAKVGWP